MGRGALSGINYGENLGLAFTGSGTLGAAFEADSLGIPVIAFSRSIPQQYQKSEDISVTLMTSLMSVDADTYHR
jgi:5'/3'-nucleotidase SurE